MKKIGILGSGMVAQTLGMGFLQHGYQVMLGTRDVNKLQTWQQQAGKNASVGSFQAAADYGDMIVLALKGTVVESVLKGLSTASTAGKTIIDATNPIADAAPQDGVLQFTTDLKQSLMEKLQQQTPAAHFVKAFNSVGHALMINPKLPDGPPTMFICGNHLLAKQQVETILGQFGWQPQDMGTAVAARAIEPLCMLWCIRGFRENQWQHAFKLLKA